MTSYAEFLERRTQLGGDHGRFHRRAVHAEQQHALTNRWRDRAEASRRDWAIEAVAMDEIGDRLLSFHAHNEDRFSFISRRYHADGSGLNFRRSRCTGVSSDALAWYAVGRRDEPKLSEYPADESDLSACERTYAMASEWLQERMLPVLERYRAHVRPVCTVHPEGDE